MENRRMNGQQNRDTTADGSNLISFIKYIFSGPITYMNLTCKKKRLENKSHSKKA
jgi:hypothetical protein